MRHERKTRKRRKHDDNFPLFFLFSKKGKRGAADNLVHGVASPVASRHSPGLACSLRLRRYCWGGRRDEKKSDERLLGKGGNERKVTVFIFFFSPKLLPGMRRHSKGRAGCRRAPALPWQERRDP